LLVEEVTKVDSILLYYFISTGEVPLVDWSLSFERPNGQDAKSNLKRILTDGHDDLDDEEKERKEMALFDPVRVAAEENQFEVAKFLIEKKDFVIRQVALNAFSRNGNIEAVRYIISFLEGKGKWKKEVALKKTTLYAALDGGHLGMTRFLLHSKCPYEENYVLIHASKSGNFELFKFVFALFGFPENPDDAKLVFENAVASGKASKAFIEFLFQRHFPTSGRLFPLACHSGNVEIMQLLMDLDLVNMQDHEHAVGDAFESGSIEAVRFLLAKSFSITVAAAYKCAFSADARNRNSMEMLDVLFASGKTFGEDFLATLAWNPKLDFDLRYPKKIYKDLAKMKAETVIPFPKYVFDASKIGFPAAQDATLIGAILANNTNVVRFLVDNKISQFTMREFTHAIRFPLTGEMLELALSHLDLKYDLELLNIAATEGNQRLMELCCRSGVKGTEKTLQLLIEQEFFRGNLIPWVKEALSYLIKNLHCPVTMEVFKRVLRDGPADALTFFVDECRFQYSPKVAAETIEDFDLEDLERIDVVRWFIRRHGKDSFQLLSSKWSETIQWELDRNTQEDVDEVPVKDDTSFDNGKGEGEEDGEEGSIDTEYTHLLERMEALYENPNAFDVGDPDWLEDEKAYRSAPARDSFGGRKGRGNLLFTSDVPGHPWRGRGMPGGGTVGGRGGQMGGRGSGGRNGRGDRERRGSGRGGDQ